MLVTVLVGLAVAALVAVLVVFPRIRERVGRNIAETTSGPIAYLAGAVAEAKRAGTAEATLKRARPRFGTPLDIVPRGTLRLEADIAERLDAGEVVQTSDFLRSVMLARIDGTEDVLVVGPINAVHPLGEGRGLALILLFIGGLATGVFLLVEPIRRRLGALARATAAFGRGDLTARATPGPRDAIGALGGEFNRMADEVQRLVGAHQQLLRMVSHELRTPLQRLHFTVERVREAPAEDREQALDLMARDLDELDALIEELLTYVRLKDHPSPRRERIDAGAVLEELCASLAPLGGGVELRVLGRSAEPVILGVEGRYLKRTVSNLITNALRHARSRVEVRAARAGGQVLIDVDDDGPGIPRDLRERVFEPFQRLGEDGPRGSRGFGLGLAIVRRIAHLYGGTVVVLDSDLGGARLRVTLPAD